MNYTGNFFPSGSPENASHFTFEGVGTPAVPTFKVPDAHLLFSGDYQRIGSDLIISDQLSRVVVPDYFKALGHSRPFLVSPDGAPFPPDFVDALTGYTAYAQAGAQSAAGKVVGHIIKMTGSASIVRNGVTIVANVGEVVYQSDVVQTGSNSTIGLVLDDGSTFNLSGNSRFLLGDLTFDPNSTSNSAFLTLVQGAASFVAGQVAKTGDMRIATPVASIGIRGTAVQLDISSTDGTVSISVIDQRDGALHAVEVFNNAGMLIGTVTSNGASLTLTPTVTFDVIAQQVNKTADQVAQEFNAFQQVLSTYDAAKQIFPNLPQHTDNSDHQNNNADTKEVTRFASSAPLNPPGTEYHPPAAQAQTTSTETPPTISVTINPVPAAGAPASTSTSLDALGEPPISVKLISLPFVVTPGHVTAITSGPGDHTGPVMSASGDVVYDPDGAIYFYDRGTNTTTTIASPSGGWSYGSPTISSDGRYILYQGSNGNGSYIFVYGTDPADSTHYHVQTQLAPGDAPAINGDGSTILAHNTDGSIAIYGLQGNLKGTITPAAVGSSGALRTPCISADGHLIVFWNSDSTAAGGAGHLFSFDLSTGNFSHIGDTSVGAVETPPTVSADGHLIAYQSTDATNHSEIYLYDLNVGAVVFQTAGASSSYSPVLSPDGHFLVFTSNAALTAQDNNAVADVYIVDVTHPAAPEYRLVSEAGGLSSAGGVAISAGGQYVAFASNSHIFFADPTSGHSAVITETANSPEILSAKGTIALTGDYAGVKISTADQFGVATPHFKAEIDQLGNIRWAFTETKNDFAFLYYGQDATQKFVITLSADDGSVTIPIFVTVHNGVQPIINVADFAPVAKPVTLQDGQQDVSYTITAGALLTGVVDVDGPSASIASLSLRGGGGSLSQVDSQTWSFTPDTGFSGRVIFDYEVTDSIKSAASTASLDIALPLAIVSIAPDTGANGDFITNSENLTVSGTNGTLFAGERIQVSSDNGATWSDVLQTSATTWSFADPFQHDVNFSYQARVIDSANITINSTSQAIVVDITAPTAALAITAISSDSRTAGDFVTSDTTLTVSGSNGALGSGEKIQVSSDGGATWADVTQSTATSWSYLDPATHAGSFTYQTRIIDAAGNVGTTASQAVTIDTTAPSETLAITAIATDSGSSSSDFITSDTTLTVSGSNGALGSGEKIQVSSDGGTTWADVAQSTATSWSYLDPATHAGSFTYQTRIIDAAGNVGTTASQAVTIDTTAPTITISNVGGPTNQANQTITGTADVADAGATVTVYDGSTAIKTAIVQGDGSWSAQVTLANGSHSLTAKVSDLAGNTTTSNAVVYTLSTTGPAVTEHLTSDTGSSALDQITSNPALSGTGLANTTVHFTIDGTLIATTTLADGSGNWSFIPSGLGDGLHTIVASQTDTFGNTGSASLTFALDTTAPSEALAITAISSDSGSSSSDFVTSDTTLTVSGSNGALGSGEKIQVSSDGGATWADVTQSTATSWSYLDPATHAGSFTYQTRIIDAAGNVGTTASQAVTIDTTAPTAALAITAISSDSGSSSSDFVTSDTTLTVSGSNGALGSGEKIQVSSDGGATWADVTQSTGTSWSYVDPVTHASSFTYQTRIIDAAGNIGTTASQAVTIDTTAPTITISNVGGPTNQANQTITGTVDVADAGATVTVYDGGTAIKTAIVQGDGSWSAQVTLANGSHSLTAKVSDLAGNTTTSNAVVYTLSTTGPAVTEHLTSDTGSSALDQITSNPALSGTGLANTTVHFTIDGTLIATTTLADGNGSWSFTPSGLGDGLHTIVASQTDTFGNTGSAPLTFTLDTTAPSEALAITAINQDSGTVGDFVTNDTTLTVSGSNGALGSGEKIQVSSDGGATWADVTQSTATSWSYLDPATHAGSFTYQTRIIDAAGNIGTTASQAVTIDTTAPTITISNVGGPTNQANQTITGTVDVADAGATVTVYDGGTAIKTAIVQGDGSWSAQVTLANGSHSLTAKVSDLAGNTTTSNAVVYTLSTTGPAVTEHLTSDTGSSALDQITSNPALSGTGLANTTVHFTIDGTLIATTTLADGSGNWSFTPSGLGDGLHTIVASQTDTFGNTGSASLTFALDTTAPSASAISTVTDNVSPVTGTIANNGSSNDKTLTIAGTAEAGSTVRIYDTDGLTVVGSGLAAAGGYSITTSALTEGSHTLTARATDAAGNQGAASTAFHVGIDSLPPTDITLSNTSIAENSAVGTVVGSFSDVDPGATGTASFTLVDDAAGRFGINGGNLVLVGSLDYETAQLHQITVRVTDSAGNTFNKALTVIVTDVAGITLNGDAGANVLVGTPEADTLNGLGGNDRLQGLGGNDTLDGGAGFDRAVYSDATGSVTVNLAAGTGSGAGVGSDTLISIEAAVGGDFADTFGATGFAGSSAQPGVALGQSAFEGRGGDDVITGRINDLGQSLTRAEYLSASAAVTVDLAARTGQGTAAGDAANVGHDTFTNALQGVYGSAYGDTIYGSNNATFTYEVFEGRGGDDYIDGRGGYDMVAYNNDTTTTSGITVNLAAGTVVGDSTVGTDTLRDVEAVRGTNFNDVLDATGYGSAGALNVSSTNGTFNDFAGAGGNDTIIGNGNTRLNYSSAQAAVTVDLQITAGTSITVAGSATGASEGTDTFTGVNAVHASVFADTLLGSSYNNNFTGLGGDDYIDGRGGFDTAIYNNLNTVTGGVAVNMAAGTVTGDASTGTDTLRNIEAVQGTGYTDSYDATGYGGAGALNVSTSNGSFNQFEGLGGDDGVTGNGNTRMVYSNATGAVTITIGAGGAGSASGDASTGHDTFTGGVNSAIGSNSADIYNASGFNGGFNSFQGNGGNDIITGNGSTQVQYSNSTSGVTITIGASGAGSASGDSSVGSDTFVSGVNSALGSNQNDTYNASGYGAGLYNSFQGNGGNDTITGNGSTQVQYNNATSSVTITIGAGGTGSASGDSSVGTDSFTGVNSALGSNFDDTYIASSFSPGQFNSFQGNGGNDTITGNGSTQIEYFGATGGVTVNLTTGIASGSASVGTDTIIGGVSGVQGSNFSDTITGSLVNDSLFGNGGNDTLAGADGNDYLAGGSGADTFVYANGGGVDYVGDFNRSEGDRIDLTGVTGIFTLADIQARATQQVSDTRIDFGGGNTITLANITVGSLVASDFVFNNSITGTSANDVLVGTSQNDGIVGLGGNDRLQGLGGDDTLDGGNGFDRAVYSDATGSVTVNLAAGTGSGAGVGSDTLISIEAAVGGDSADTFDATGFAGSSAQPGVALGQSAFEGRGGDDVITGRINDLGQSLTRAEYLSASAAVTVDLAARTGQGTAAGDAANVGHDTFTNALQGVYGSAYGDTIYGSNNATFTYEVFEGRGGDDYIDGRGGYDMVAYNNDTTTTSGITVNLAAGTVVGDSTVGTDTLRDVEAVRGTNFNDVLDATGYGSAGALNVSSTNGTFNDFAGAGGNDTIIGNGNTRLNYSSAQAAVTVDLQITAGTSITVAGSATGASEGTDTFTGVNAVHASVFADTLLGSSYNNNFTGLGGDDYIDGRGGFDTAIYNNLNTVTGGVAVNMAAGTVTGDASTGTDTLRNIEAVQGTGYTDSYDATGYGGAGALNVSTSNGSFNQFEGLGGDDGVTGNGNTRMVYSNATGAVTITIGAGGAGSASGDASTGHDTFTGGVNSAIGSNSADIYNASGFNGGFNSFQGNGGNDIITGNGSTQVQYSNATSAVTIDLIAGTAIGNGSVGTDSITGGVNSVVGSNFDDVISGTNNTTITDVYFGGGGNDTINGRGGYDLANYNDSSISAAITVNLAAGTVVGDSSVGSDILHGVELVRGTRFADTFDATGFNDSSTNAGSYDFQYLRRHGGQRLRYRKREHTG